MQLTIADWRLAIEHKSNGQTKKNDGTNNESKLERVVRRARMLQDVENERRSAQDRLLLGGAYPQF